MKKNGKKWLFVVGREPGERDTPCWSQTPSPRGGRTRRLDTREGVADFFKVWGKRTHKVVVPGYSWSASYNGDTPPTAHYVWRTYKRHERGKAV